MLNLRSSGLLLHPTSLPGEFGIGDLGKYAYQFVDFMVKSNQKIWQILPLGPTGFGNSPYMCYSAFAGNPLLINLEWLVSEELLSQDDLDQLPHFPPEIVDFDRVIAHKIPLLKKASQSFWQKATEERKKQFADFCKEHHWLKDYALFMALKTHFNGQSWHQWESKIAHRDPATLQYWTEKLQEEIFFHKYIQSEFFRQWKSLKNYANEHHISIFGDIPIYVAHDSADVWANPHLFRLKKDTLEPAWMAGVPPDYFSETGQLWGNPVYHWRNVEKTNFAWWVDRIKTILEYVDIVRIDHFRGFEAFWAVPHGAEDARQGRWAKAKGEAFFNVLKQQLGQLPIVAEDLGVITPEVEHLRDHFEFPGMKILQFAFDSDRANPFLPFNYTNRNCVAYTGTHDNDTTVGWFYARSEEEQARVKDYLGCICEEGVHWGLIRLAMQSVADKVLFPLQDILGLDTSARMNKPGVATGNWGWRYTAPMLTDEITEKLAYITYLYGRQ